MSNNLPMGSPVSPEFVAWCRRLSRFILRSFHEMTPERQRLAECALSAAHAVEHPEVFAHNATFQRSALADIAAFTGLSDQSQQPK